jgi:3-phosphoshikimate 1-carboxyvinyltransferase
MGAQITTGANWIEASAPPAGRLQGIEIDCNHIPDAAMTLATTALFAEGPTTLRHIASWRVKETDRIAAMATELRKLGAVVEEGADYIRIDPPVGRSAGSAIDTYDDHRMAMSCSLAALGTPLRINDPETVAKTFPDYFARFAEVGQGSGDRHRRHLGFGQRHHRRARRAGAGLALPRFRRSLSFDRPGRTTRRNGLGR